MKQILALFLLAIISITAFGANKETIRYAGQTGDHLNLDIINTVTRYREEERDTTCTRKIPYEAEECGYETRYRQECHWEPGRNVCHTEYDRQCRTVTRYRQECYQEPGRQVCRNTPPRQVCRNNQCRTLPGRRICDSKPGRQICRQVPYQTNECRSVPRQVCRTIPGQNVCDHVPYQEWVCRTVTRYRDEQYPCRRTVQVPYSFDRKVKAELEIDYINRTGEANLDFIFELLENGEINLKALDHSEAPVLVSLDKQVDRDVQNDFTNTRGKYVFTLNSTDEVLAPLMKGVNNLYLGERSLSFHTGKISDPSRVKVFIKLIQDRTLSGDKVVFQKTMSASEFNLIQNSDSTKLSLNLAQFGVDLKKREHKVLINIGVELGQDILNPPRGGLNISRQFTYNVK